MFIIIRILAYLGLLSAMVTNLLLRMLVDEGFGIYSCLVLGTLEDC